MAAKKKNKSRFQAIAPAPKKRGRPPGIKAGAASKPKAASRSKVPAVVSTEQRVFVTMRVLNDFHMFASIVQGTVAKIADDAQDKVDLMTQELEQNGVYDLNFSTQCAAEGCRNDAQATTVDAAKWLTDKLCTLTHELDEILSQNTDALGMVLARAMHHHGIKAVLGSAPATEPTDEKEASAD